MESELIQLQNWHVILEHEKERLRVQRAFLQSEVEHVRRRLERARVLQHLGLQHDSQGIEAEGIRLERELQKVERTLHELEEELSARVQLTIGHLLRDQSSPQRPFTPQLS